MKNEIKVGFVVAYDWYFLENSLPLVYEEADKICISIDKNRIGWSGKPFSFDENGFQNMLERLDYKKKIILYEDSFYEPELTPIQNDTRQRQMMAERLGRGGWHVQIDADEYFVQFNQFAKWLRNTAYSYPVNIVCPSVTLFKQVEEGFLVVDAISCNSAETLVVATNEPAYKHAKISDWFNILAPFEIIHQSWARNNQEINQKIRNWGHSKDFDTVSFMSFWSSLSLSNYKEYIDFHPIYPREWHQLLFIPGEHVNDVVSYYMAHPLRRPTPVALALRNSRWMSRIKKVFTRILPSV